jgi:hypothetical protein
MEGMKPKTLTERLTVAGLLFLIAGILWAARVSNSV